MPCSCRGWCGCRYTMVLVQHMDDSVSSEGRTTGPCCKGSQPRRERCAPHCSPPSVGHTMLQGLKRNSITSLLLQQLSTTLYASLYTYSCTPRPSVGHVVLQGLKRSLSLQPVASLTQYNAVHLIVLRLL